MPILARLNRESGISRSGPATVTASPTARAEKSQHSHWGAILGKAQKDVELEPGELTVL